MSTIITPYGYDIVLEDGTDMPTLVTPEQIAIASNGRISATDSRLDWICQAVSGAIRDFCGWHVSPTLSCVLRTEVSTRVIMLPAKLVTSIESIEVGNDAVTDYEWRRSGAIRLGCAPARRGRWGAYEVSYHAGLDMTASPLAQVAAQVALNNLMAAPGVRSESVGQVSLSYNQLTEGVSGGVQLLDRDKDLLRQYRLQTLS